MVSEQDKARFKAAFNRLAVATRLRADDTDPAMQRIYFDGLSDLPIDAIERAAETIARDASWFPKVAEWRDAAKRERFTLTIKALPPVPGDRALACDDCQDTGWRIVTCAPGARCSRPRCQAAPDEYTHTAAVACACRQTNPAYQHDRLAMFGTVPFDARMRAAGRDE